MKKWLPILLTLLLLAGCAVPAPETVPATEPVAEAVTTAPTEEPKETICKDGVLIVHFIDVGQADCALLECDGQAMLIDGGNTEDGWDVVEYIQDQGIEQLDLVVGTHPHEDHIGGLPAVLDAFPVEELWSGHIPYTGSATYAFTSMASDKGVEIQYPQLGDTYDLGSARVTVLGPVKLGYEDVNDLSLVLMVEYGQTRFLFTGDMEMIAEDDMLDHWADDSLFQADVLKVGHHGSYSSTGYRFLRAVMPTYAVISVGGNNEYGHPHDDPMSRLRDAEVSIYRTDKMYDIVAVSDGCDITFTWENRYAKPWTPDAA